jgi:hypothetical protein
VVDDFIDIVESPTPEQLAVVYATVLNGAALDKSNALTY